ncbi:MAG TPA: nucleotidyltransferase domain-containing protein [Candidatus Saccharimonadales bacterium]|nr:nucleotidyltransferase domain-containing protein [Candidatus Saccharimonadales bacterium]
MAEQRAEIDSSLAIGSMPPPSEASVQILNGLSQAAEHMETSLPGFVGMTAFGSAVRGEANEDSDGDIFVFVRPDKNSPSQNHPAAPVEQPLIKTATGATRNTVEFNPDVRFGYNQLVYAALKKADIKKADITVLPLDESIVTEAVNDLMGEAQKWDTGVRPLEPAVPRNIRGLFHLPINDRGLQPYIEQVLTALSTGGYGDTAWRMLRHRVVSFEHRKGSGMEGVEHRYIPATLEEARGYYLHRP